MSEELIDWDEIVTVHHLGFNGEVVLTQRLPRHMLIDQDIMPSSFVSLDRLDFSDHHD